MKKIDILECTLRDGSYAIDYQFTAKDTAIIAKALENLGFKYIEIGHGLGLNASSIKRKAAETDEVYLQTAQQILQKSKFGMFFIPGIGRKADIDLAAKYGMGFIRIGTNVSEADEAEEYIKYAKDKGMIVFSNLMKSYALPPNKFAEKAKIVDKYGADIICLVDSAGGMLPPDVKNYLIEMQKAEVQAKIGFHGHNNLMMGITNSLEAIEYGATIIDTSLKGLGRSAGNVPTEIFLTILKKKGYDLGIDIFKTMDIAEEFAKDIMKVKVDNDPITITSGYAEFHSSFLNTIYKASSKYSIDPRRLIISVSEVDKVNVPEELAMRLAKQLQKERAALSQITMIDFPEKFDIPRIQWDKKYSLEEKVISVANHISNSALKTGKQTIFVINISALYDDLNIILPYIFETSSYVMGSCEMTDLDEIFKVIENIDGLIDFIIIDDEKKKKNLYNLYEEVKNKVKKSSLLTYKGNRVWIHSIENIISCLQGNLYNIKIGIVGINYVSIMLAISLSERGARVVLFDSKGKNELINASNILRIKNSPYPIKRSINVNEFIKDVKILIGLDRSDKITLEMVKNFDKDGIIIDAIFDSINPIALDFAQKIKIKLYNVDERAAMAGEMTTVLRTNNILEDTGEKFIGDIRIITPTIIGKKGDIIVDSIIKPTEVIGVADGKGMILQENLEYTEKIKKIELEIIKKKVEGKEF